MKPSAIKVQNLLAALRSKNASGTVYRADLNAAAGPAVDLLLDALSDQHHPFAHDLADLHRLVRNFGASPRDSASERKQHQKIKSLRLPAQRLYFSPNPGAAAFSGDGAVWPLQLLLCVAAHSARARELAKHLPMTEKKILETARGAADATMGRWSIPQAGLFFQIALARLTLEEEVIAVALRARDLTQGSQTVRLSPLEARFLDQLLRRSGRPVRHQDLKAAGILNPARIKASLMRKTEGIGIRLNICATPQTYTILQ